MRIIHIATLITPDGAYGGPIRVAVNQVRALREAGHDAILIAAAKGFDGEFPETFDGAPVRLFPAVQAVPGTGFSGLTSPSLLRWLRKEVKNADVVHIHLSRDLVTLLAANLVRRIGVRYVLQTHGMVARTSNKLSVPLDTLLTRRILGDAAAVFHLTHNEREELASVGQSALKLTELHNGVPLTDRQVLADAEGVIEVLFLARLQERKRPATFVRMAIELTARFPDVRFRLVGPDEGQGDIVRGLIADVKASANIAWEGSIAPSKTLDRISRASIFVLPSVDEPFPMSVLEAMSVGLPVIVTTTCGLAPFIEEAGAGIVVDESIESLTRAVATLISDAQVRQRYGARAATTVRSNFGMSAVVKTLEAHYSAGTLPDSRIA